MYLAVGDQQLLDGLALADRSIQDGLHVQLLQVLVLPVPPAPNGVRGCVGAGACLSTMCECVCVCVGEAGCFLLSLNLFLVDFSAPQFGKPSPQCQARAPPFGILAQGLCLW